jgi:hypothetical protein
VAFPPESFLGIHDERATHLVPAVPRGRSKKERWFAEKAVRPRLHLDDSELQAGLTAARRGTVNRQSPNGTGRLGTARPLATAFPTTGFRIQPLTTLFNLWTREALPILPGQSLDDHLHPFLRDHYTNQATTMDTRLVDILTRVALRFSAQRIEVVSGYRSPKYNLTLRKKGREVARQSQHPDGTAVDFRIRGVPTKTVVNYVRSLRRGGVGYYPRSQFIHSDTGRVRYWTGT